MDTLDDFLIPQIAKYLPSPLDIAFRASCWHYRKLISSPKKMSPDDLLAYGTETDNVDIRNLALEHGARDFTRMSAVAAFIGRLDLCDLARELCATIGATTNGSATIDLNWSVRGAARGGHRALCELLCSRIPEEDPWITTIYDWILLEAARSDNLELCNFARNHGAKMCDWMLAEAARKGNNEMCQLADMWGARVTQAWAIEAAFGGHIALCKFARERYPERIDMPCIDQILSVAALRGYRDICDLAREWGATSPTNLLFEAICGNHPAIRDLARSLATEDITRIFAGDKDAIRQFIREKDTFPNSWMIKSAIGEGNRAICEMIHECGATNYCAMLVAAARHGQSELCDLVHEWVAENPLEFRRAYKIARDVAAYGGHYKIYARIRQWDHATTL
jgi:hypothetical protein